MSCLPTEPHPQPEAPDGKEQKVIDVSFGVQNLGKVMAMIIASISSLLHLAFAVETCIVKFGFRSLKWVCRAVAISEVCCVVQG